MSIYKEEGKGTGEAACGTLLASAFIDNEVPVSWW